MVNADSDDELPMDPVDMDRADAPSDDEVGPIELDEELDAMPPDGIEANDGQDSAVEGEDVQSIRNHKIFTSHSAKKSPSLKIER